MHQPDSPPPLTRPSWKYFAPYRQTIIGSLVVAALVGMLILAVQWLVGGR